MRKKYPDGIYLRFGRLMEHNGKALSIYWSTDMLDTLKRYFPNTPNNDMADMLQVSKKTLQRKAAELGLKKDPEYISNVNRQRAIVMNHTKGKLW